MSGSEYDEGCGEDFKKVETEKKAHALEKWLDLEEGSTEVEKISYSFPSKKSDRYDPKDREIEEQAHKIFEEAMTGYHTLENLLSGIEPKYRARMAEVALAYLNTALSATDTKNKQKEALEKRLLQQQKITSGDAGKGNKFFITADRNELLKKLREEEDIENGVIDITEDGDVDHNAPDSE